MPKFPVLAGAAAVLVALAAAAYFALSPGFAVTQVQDYVTRMTGRSLAVTGGAHLELAPALAIRLDGVSLGNPAGMDGNIMSARSLRLPVRFIDLIQRRIDSNLVSLVEPRFSFVIDEAGQANWVMTGGPSPLRLALENASVAYLDLRNGQSYGVSDVNAAALLSATGELNLDGSAQVNGAFTRFQAYVKSPARIAADGSPFDLTLAAPALQASLTGRLATAAKLSLAGQASLSGGDLRQALRWAGAPLGGKRGFKTFAVSGRLDGQGEAFTLTDAAVRLDGLSATGRVGLDLAPPTPVFLADLVTGRVDVGDYIEPPATADWDGRPLGLVNALGLDAQLSLAMDDLVVRGFATGPAKLTGSLVSGKFMAQLEAEKLKADMTLGNGGFTLGLRTERPVFGWLTGSYGVALKVAGTGASEQEIVSTLKGDAEINATTGSLRGIDVRAAVAKAGAAVLDGWPSGGTTAFDTAAAKFTLADGIATVVAMSLDGASVRLTGRGEIDLLRRALDLKFDPRFVTGGTSSSGLPVAVVVRGAWAAPKIYPDVPDILVDPESAYLALKAMGQPTNGSN